MFLTSVESRIRRKVFLTVAGGLIATGLVIRSVGSPPGWLSDHGGGMIYVLFWCFAARYAWPESAASRIVVAVLGATCVVEGLQLWHPLWLESVRSTSLGSILLGSSFDVLDIMHYSLAAGIGLLALRWLDGSREA